MEKDTSPGKFTSQIMKVNHPSAIVKPELAAQLREHGLEAEQLKELHPVQLAIIYREKWFQLLVPKSKGGLELPLPEILQLEEALAWIDGSLGWTVTLCAGSGWFVGFMNPELANEVFSNEKVCLGGSGKPSGVAKKVKDGYEINGFWNYSTGAPHTTGFTANCIIEENGKSLLGDNGEPLIRPFLFHRNEVTIHDNWKVVGMIATASQAFEVKQLKVSENRMFIPDSEHSVIHSPLFKYPFMPFAEATLAINISGMTMRFLDLCKGYFNKEVSSTVLAELKAANRNINIHRSDLYTAVGESWEMCVNSHPINPVLLEDITKVCRQLVGTARNVINELYPCCGLAALHPSSEINRLWRNFHTACQHKLLNGCGN
jgi:hypothetical protein